MTLKDNIAELRERHKWLSGGFLTGIVLNLNELKRLLDFTDAAIPILECASAKDEPMGDAARALLAQLDEEV